MAQDNTYTPSVAEEEVALFWQKNNVFEKSMEHRDGQPLFSFYDGPPFANGLPHFGHTLVTSIKDAILRYKTMRGYSVPRRNGWDCHGLPVEYDIEKSFGVSGKKQILELGLEKFNNACRESIFTYKDEWEVLLQRLGRWSEYDKYYATVDTTYTESVWWSLKQINDKGLLYKGFKCTAYCPRCETPLSNFEVNDGYKDDVPDPSLYVKFKIRGEDTFLLAWTTTPWSLPGNAAVAVNPHESYVYVRLKDDNGTEETLILAKKRLEVLGRDDYRVLKEVSGNDLVGLRYEPLFSLDQYKTTTPEQMYKVWPATFVSIEDGTGVLHVAPAFGEDDLELGTQKALDVLKTVDASGKLTPGIGCEDVEGKFFKGADKHIIEHLTEQGSVYAAETFTHTYPFCWRCETPLMYYAISSWFIRVSAIRDELAKTAEEINWVPGNIKDGRFGKWLEGARDWSVSRNRYWGAPMPIWVNVENEDDYIVVDSFDTLRDLIGDKNLDLSDVHRPKIDDVVIERDGKTYKRIEEVLDCWFESGSMSIAQYHYPFENKELFEKSFPADFVIEGLDQTRLWFYVQHVVATILFDQPAYKNVIVNGILMASDGQKLSKRLKNYPPIEDVLANEGADSLRLYLLSSTQATETADYMRFDRQGLKDISRNIVSTLWNTYRFYEMYASIDSYQPTSGLVEPENEDNILDQWLIARIQQTTLAATASADAYKIAHAIEPIFGLIDDMSNWYVRRSRRRFWKTEDDTDKLAAYATLHYALTQVSLLLAPWAPFVSEYLYQRIKTDDMPLSVHICDYPEGNELSDTSVVTGMRIVRELVRDGLSQRADEGIKVRQPLAGATVTSPYELSNELKVILQEELNLKSIVVKKADSQSIALNTKLTQELKNEGLVREIIRNVQQARKTAGLDVDNRIELKLETSEAILNTAIEQFSDILKNEVLATTLESSRTSYMYSNDVVIEKMNLTISLEKAA